MNARQIPVLMYHNVHPDASVISISPEIFSRQINWLDRQGYLAIGLSFLIDHIRYGKELPDNSIFLTFDDGFASLYKYVFPILQKHGFSATIFLVSGYCGKNNDWPGQLPNIPRMPLLNWDQIHEMDENGFEFGGHSASHPMLDELNIDDLRVEIQGSKEHIEDRLGHKITSFAYPYGRFNRKVKSLVEEVFQGACSTIAGHVHSKSDPYEICRIDINLVKDLWLFRALKSAAFPGYLTFRRSLRSVSRVVFNTPYW